MQDAYLPILRLLPLEAGKDLKLFAVNGRLGQIVPPCHCDRDAYLSVQQGQMRLESAEGSKILQSHEGAFLPAGQVFQLESLTDTRARLVMPAQSRIDFDLDGLREAI